MSTTISNNETRKLTQNKIKENIKGKYYPSSQGGKEVQDSLSMCFALYRDQNRDLYT